MVGKKTQKDAETRTLVGRIGWLRDKLWSGSQTRMAADLGVSQGTIANILGGRRKPGRGLLAAISAHPLVNPDWLIDGRGRPLVPEATGGETALPVARELFSGTPDKNGDHLDNYLLPVPRRLFKPTRYWIQVTEDHPLARDKQLRVGEGDHVLFEPDADGWPMDTRGHPCIAKIGRGKSARLSFARLLEHASKVRTTGDFVFLEQHTDKETRCASVAAVGIYRCGGFDVITVSTDERTHAVTPHEPCHRRITI